MSRHYEIDEMGFAQREASILSKWRAENTFTHSVENRVGRQTFAFYDGPPFATGLPHYGHILAGTIKDVIPRYKTMKGFYVPRRFGWDCHGLPVEQEIEKEFGIKGKHAIEEFGVAAFNEQCRHIVLRYTKEWQETVERMGRFVDFAHVYKTMDRSFMESVWWVFASLYEKGLIYEGFKVVPYSAKLGTPLSNFEAGENYKEVDDPSLVVHFPLTHDPETAMLAWTTTPWTLVSNMALMINPEVTYAKVCHEGRYYILAKDLVANHFTEPTVVETFVGSTLLGHTYTPPFSYFLDKRDEGAFRIIAGEDVSTQDGTGVVHTAPAFGEADFVACQKQGIPLVCPVDDNGAFTQEVPEHQGLFVKDADKALIKELKSKGLVFSHTSTRHRYPFCWRSDTPLIYKAVKSLFLHVEAIKDKLLETNAQTSWTPSHLKNGRFGKWLEGARDWNISRNRYWGTPIPLYKSPSGKTRVIRSAQELETLTNSRLDDLHRHHIDDKTFTIDGETYTRIPQVFDCWFESGSMPYGQNHYPFSTQTLETFPADFIAEGLDQTRGWFYTLMVLSTALFDKPAFKNVIVNGTLLAENGQKMSKRLKNYPDPLDVTEKYGADAIRLYLLNSPAIRADDLCFSERGVELALRQVLIPLWNVYVFFATYANINSFEAKGLPQKLDHRIDQWIVSKTQQLLQLVEQGLDDYNLQQAVEPFVHYIDLLTNWYIRRSRRRFWEEKPSPDRDQAFETLHHVLLTVVKIAAPFIPFLTDTMYRALQQTPHISVHLSDYPTYTPSLRQESLEQSMEVSLRAVTLGHSLRKEHRLKVRQPLQTAFMVSSNPEVLEALRQQKALIQDELNVKEVVFSSDEAQFVSWSVQPHFRRLGKKVGKFMPQVQKALQTLGATQIADVSQGKPLSLPLDPPLVIEPEDLMIKRHVKEGVIASHDTDLIVALDPHVSQELSMEGLARELVNKINTMRRSQKFEVTDRVRVSIASTPKVEQAFTLHANYITQEILATQVLFCASPENGESWDLNGELASIFIEKTL